MSKIKVLLLSVFLLSFIAPLKGQLKNGLPGDITKPQPSGKSFVNNLPLLFLENSGQVNSEVRFYTRTSDYILWATSDTLTFDRFIKKRRGKTSRSFYQMKFPGNCLKKGKIHSVDKTSTPQNIFTKRDGKNIHQSAKTSLGIKYKEIFKGVDLKVYGKEKKIEYDWIVKPMEDPGKIRFKYEHVKSTYIDKKGNIVISKSSHKQLHSKPVAYQIIDGKKQPVEASFKKFKETNTYGFSVGHYNKNHPLIIDPVVLVYSSYLGGSNINEYNYGFYSHNMGKLYVTGCTASSDYPFVEGMESVIQGGHFDVFISVIDTNLSGSNSLIYSTVLGGDGVDAGYGIYADSGGIIYLSGWSSDGSIKDGFPTTDGGHSNGTYDILFAKIDPSLTQMSQLLIAKLYGGTGRDFAKGLAVRNYNEIYISGMTASSTGFPLTSTAYSSTKKGNYDYFLMRLNSLGQIQYCTYFGGSNYGDEEESHVPLIDLTSTGKVYMTGRTLATDFPVKNGYQSTLNGVADGIIALFDTFQSGPSSLICSTYFGGVGWDQINNLHVSSDDTLYITGTTESNAGTGLFPVTAGAYQTTKNGTYDAFVAKMSLSGSQLNNDYCTYFGGSGTQTGRAIKVNASGHILFGGATKGNDFPLVNSYQGPSSGSDTGFISLLDVSSGGQGLIFSTCIGGSQYDHVKFVSFAPNGRLLAAGITASTNYPVTTSAYQSQKEGSYDTFITLIDPN